MKDIVHFVMWLFIGALVVLIVTHPSGFATSVGAVGGQLTTDAHLLAGQVPNNPSTGKPLYSSAA